MNELVEKGYITEMMCKNNLTYIINDDSLFLTTEYKVLQSLGDGSFVKCMKMLYNGKIQMFFQTQEYRSLASLLPQLDADRFLALVSNLIEDVLEVYENGFLSCQNIVLDFERLYVDTTTYKVKLIYLPISKHNYQDYAGFESALRSQIYKLISGVSNLSSPKTMQLSVDLTNSTLSLGKIHERLKGMSIGSFNGTSGTQGNSGENYSGNDDTDISVKGKLVALDAPVKIVVNISKPEFFIGRSARISDGVLGYNPAIGRRHCKVVQQGNSFYLEDMDSSNGTFLNGKRLMPGQLIPLSNGDRVQLANSHFIFEINQEEGT